MESVFTSNAEDNSFAYHVQLNERRIVHIDDVESGKKGYVCIGCGQEMIAYNRGKHDRKHYFGHDPKDVERKGKCTFSNETYRHQVAKAILQRIKQIKVPAIFLYPPAGSEGRPQKLRDAEVIRAVSVGIEHVFYENEQGEIQCCPRADWRALPNQYLLIQPDVTFFDADNNPILLIEVVATHKIDDEKKFKLRCLGINTVSVNIPKALPEVIEQTFYSVQHTQWAYNHEQATAQYVQISGQSANAVPSVDELPDEFHEETYRCRTTQLNGLIRAFEKCLDSESYRTVEANIRAEQSRVSANTERDRQRLCDLQGQHQKTIRIEFADRIQRLNDEQTAESEHFQDLGRRYQSKKRQLDEDGERLAEREANYIQRWKRFLERVEDEIAALETRIKGFGTWGTTVEARRATIGRETAAVERQIEAADREEAAIDERRAALSTIYQREEKQLNDQFREAEAGIEPTLAGEIERIEREAEHTEHRIRNQHKQYREQAAHAVEQRDGRLAPRLSERIKSLLEAIGYIDYIKEKERYQGRLLAARKWAKARAWQQWS
ncbi:hypothetical protein A6C57_26885 (plasmid) [Fibrella sp. ES10-3-2-2]